MELARLAGSLTLESPKCLRLSGPFEARIACKMHHPLSDPVDEHKSDAGTAG
jgi:hypothetical protein